ncbi:hypothetical protein HZH68_003368 [Vespula germanica]|uniref:Uncharacterized protein n=2 Tax=Vespula TaxID=7451 RepID=A0A834NP51_VESGE|nr:hypothetical protein HZH68_003368 [Vespula germanica]KAF7435541.1 hypothetical protein H0235_003732 [Vespula pensylvanica]
MRTSSIPSANGNHRKRRLMANEGWIGQGGWVVGGEKKMAAGYSARGIHFQRRKSYRENEDEGCYLCCGRTNRLCPTERAEL